MAGATRWSWSSPAPVLPVVRTSSESWGRGSREAYTAGWALKIVIYASGFGTWRSSFLPCVRGGGGRVADVAGWFKIVVYVSASTPVTSAPGGRAYFPGTCFTLKYDVPPSISIAPRVVDVYRVSKEVPNPCPVYSVGHHASTTGRSMVRVTFNIELVHALPGSSAIGQRLLVGHLHIFFRQDTRSNNKSLAPIPRPHPRLSSWTNSALCTAARAL